MSSGPLDREGFNLLQEIDVRLVGDSKPLHCLPQVVRLREFPSLVEVIPLKEDEGLIRIVGISEESTSAGPARLASASVLIEARLPRVVVLQLVTNEHHRHWRRALLPSLTAPPVDIRR